MTLLPRAAGSFALSPADRVWELASDGQWHTLREVAMHTQSSRDSIAPVVNFLEKYGFIQRSPDNDGWFRMIPEAPSPLEVAGNLYDLLHDSGAEVKRLL